MCYSQLSIQPTDLSYVNFFISVHFYMWQLEIFISVAQVKIFIAYLIFHLESQKNMCVHPLLIRIYTQNISLPRAFFSETVFNIIVIKPAWRRFAFISVVIETYCCINTFYNICSKKHFLHSSCTPFFLLVAIIFFFS